MQIGADTGGTFTDIVDATGRITKVLSTPTAPDDAVRRGVAELCEGGRRPRSLAHGTTVATNALLEGQLAPTALVSTEGLGDVIEIGRQDRPSLYDQFADRPPILVDRARRFEVRGRLSAAGEELVALDPASVPVDDIVAAGVVAVAVCLLHADLDPEHERQVLDVLAATGLDAVASHQVSPEYREYERTVTTVVNAGLRSRCREYLHRLTDLADRVSVMTSAGGLIDATTAGELPASLLLSGPAGGARAAAAVAVANGFPDAVSFDMGGTSTDVCLIQGGNPATSQGRHVGGYPVRFPALDIHTIGAGGGSIAGIDTGGALTVGPRSAGADPGPACYGRGGRAPTVTDANVVAGRIPPDAEFGGLRLDRGAAAAALADADIDADGVLAVVDANMIRALRAVSVERGVDPRSLALVSFGGAGSLHACSLAGALGMPAVIVPARAGVLSAVGLLTAPESREVVRSWPTPGDHDGIDADLAALARDAAALVDRADLDPAHIEIDTFLDCRYAGQSHELTVPGLGHFHAVHERRNGFARLDAAVEVVALRARATAPSTLDPASLGVPDWRRDFEPVDGPAQIAEPDSTIWVPDGWRAEPGALGAVVIRPRPADRPMGVSR